MEDILCTAHISLQGTTAHVKVMPLKLVPLIREVFVKGNSAGCRVFLFDDGTRAALHKYT